jgi:hypothetical protein
MANVYVKSGATGANNGTSWTDAYTNITSTFSTAAGNVVLVADTHAQTLAAATAFNYSNGTPAAPIPVICVNEGTGLQSTGAKVSMGNVVNGHFSWGPGSAYYYGIEFETYSSLINQGFYFTVQPTLASGPSIFTFENCLLDMQATGSAASFTIGHSANDEDFVTVILKNTNYTTSGTSNVVRFQRQGRLLWDGGSWTGTIPTSGLFAITGVPNPYGINLNVNNVDLSAAATSPLFSGNISGQAVLRNCKLGASYVPISSVTWDDTEASITLYNCMGGDTHYGFEHYNYSGQTVVDVGIYANDGAEYDTGGNKYSWKITTTANCSIYAPYVSPYVIIYNEGVSSVTPYLECMRDNSSGAVYQNDEVWAEFSYQGTAGYPLGVFVSDRMTLLGTPADQTASSKTASDWTGETGTPGFFKIGPASSITPSEIGPLSARVCVGEPSITVYVDPQIRT